MPVLSGHVSTAPQSELAWKCDSCENVFDKSFDMCPQCTSVRVTEIRMPKTRKGQVEAEQGRARAGSGPDGPGDTSGAAGPGRASAPDAHPADGTPYAGWVKKDLQRECERRELPKSGNIGDLVGRLTEYDAEHAEPGDGGASQDPEGDPEGGSGGVEATSGDPD